MTAEERERLMNLAENIVDRTRQSLATRLGYTAEKMEIAKMIESYANARAVQIAEKAVGEEAQHWEGDTTIQYVFDNLLSRIKTETKPTKIND